MQSKPHKKKLPMLFYFISHVGLLNEYMKRRREQCDSLSCDCTWTAHSLQRVAFITRFQTFLLLTFACHKPTITLHSLERENQRNPRTKPSNPNYIYTYNIYLYICISSVLCQYITNLSVYWIGEFLGFEFTGECLVCWEQFS